MVLPTTVLPELNLHDTLLWCAHACQINIDDRVWLVDADEHPLVEFGGAHHVDRHGHVDLVEHHNLVVVVDLARLDDLLPVADRVNQPLLLVHAVTQELRLVHLEFIGLRAHVAEEDHVLVGADDEHHASLPQRDEVDDFEALTRANRLLSQLACLRIDLADLVQPLRALLRDVDHPVVLFASQDFQRSALLLLSKEEIGHSGNLEAVLVGARWSSLTVADWRSRDRVTVLLRRTTLLLLL